MRMSLAKAKEVLTPLGITIVSRLNGEYRVNFVGGKPSTAYYTHDIEDAVCTGQVMAGVKPELPVKPLAERLEPNWTCGHCHEVNQDEAQDCVVCGWERRIVAERQACCPKFSTALAEDTLLCVLTVVPFTPIPTPPTTYIMSDGGQGGMEEIHYCPFCGKKL